jgi:hypothetical protein
MNVQKLQRAMLRFVRKHGIAKLSIDHVELLPLLAAMHTVAMRHGAAVTVFEFGHNGDETGDAVMLG